MVELVTNCPRCNSQSVTFDVKAVNFLTREYGWQHWYEMFGVCRHCSKATVFRTSQKGPESGFDIGYFDTNSPLDIKMSLNNCFDVRGYINIKDVAAIAAPDHLPQEIEQIFKEGATCCAIQCWNAAGTMFRTCIDLATRPLVPGEEMEGLNTRTRRDLGLRLPWLFAKGLLPTGLRELSDCVREDGNDGAHQGTLREEDAQDLLDFSYAILEHLFTEPRRLELAKERRDARRAKP